MSEARGGVQYFWLVPRFQSFLPERLKKMVRPRSLGNNGVMSEPSAPVRPDVGRGALASVHGFRRRRESHRHVSADARLRHNPGAARRVGSVRLEQRHVLGETITHPRWKPPGGSSVSTMGGFKTPFPLVLLTVFMLIAGANAHIDQDDLGQVSHKPDETWYDRPSPPPPSRDESLIGGLYDENRGPLLLKENHTYEMVCSVFIKPPAFMYVAPGVTIHVRGDCGGDDAYAWGASNPGGVSMKPSIVILPNARLEVKGTLAKPVVIRSLAGAGSASTTNGLWGGVYLFGRARVSFDLLDANRMPVGTAEGADPGPYGPAVSDAFVARNAPDGTFTVCEDEIIDGNCTTKMAPSCVDITQARENGDGFLSSSEHKFEYGGDDDGGSCGSVENLIVVNAGGFVDNNSTTVPNPVAFGLYGCGVGTSIANLEVAHSGGIGVELRGGAALLKDVAVWATKGDGVVARGGYRGVLRNAFVDVDGASPRSALRVVGDWDGDQSQTDDVAYRTHPHVYGGTFVASGDGGGGYDAGSFYEENRVNTVPTGIVATERAGGLTLVNSIVLSRSFSRTRGVTISGCSHAMDVGNENTIGAPNTTKVFTSTNRVFISDKNVITGFGAHPNVSGVPDFGAFPTSMREVFDANGQSCFVGANTTRRAVDERWLANLSNTETHTSFGAFKFTTAPPREWRAFGLVGDSCQNTLSNADDRKPQLHSSLFPSELFLTDEGNSADQPGFFDPRPTPAMRYAHSTDDPFVNAHRGFALGAPSAERTALALDAIDRFLSSPVTYPGAFTPDKNSLWFRDRTEPLSVKGATLSSQVAKNADRKYAHLTLTREFQHPTDANENKCVPLVNVMMEENQCYRAPAWLEERISPLALGVARLGSFDQTSTWRQSKLFPNDSTNATDVLADVPYNLTHDLLASANGDPESNSWAGGSVVAQLVAGTNCIYQIPRLCSHTRLTLSFIYLRRRARDVQARLAFGGGQRAHRGDFRRAFEPHARIHPSGGVHARRRHTRFRKPNRDLRPRAHVGFGTQDFSGIRDVFLRPGGGAVPVRLGGSVGLRQRDDSGGEQLRGSRSGLGPGVDSA